MTHAVRSGRVLAEMGSFFEHIAVVVGGFILMIVGLGLGVTMIMLPVGLVLGFLGLGLFLAGLFARTGEKSGAGRG